MLNLKLQGNIGWYLNPKKGGTQVNIFVIKPTLKPCLHNGKIVLS